MSESASGFACARMRLRFDICSDAPQNEKRRFGFGRFAAFAVVVCSSFQNFLFVHQRPNATPPCPLLLTVHSPPLLFPPSLNSKPPGAQMAQTEEEDAEEKLYARRGEYVH